MEIDLVKVGNSRGFRIPKAILEQCGFGEKAVLEIEDGRLMISPARRNPRQGWEEAFLDFNREEPIFAAEDAEWLEAPLSEEFDEREWTWDEG